jgi:hypothetical protein
MAPVLSSDQVERLLSYAEPVAAVVLLVRLVHAHLAFRYRAFTLYLVWIAAEIVVMMMVPRDTNYYFHVYATAEAVLYITQILVVAELFSLVTEGYPGIARSGRRFLWMALAIAVGVSLVALGFDAGQQTATGPYSLLRYLFIARFVSITLLLFLGLTLAVLFWFPIPLSRNAILYVIGYSVYFACRAMTRLAGTLLGANTVAVLSTISLAIALACLIFWTVLLSKRGESISVTVGHRWEPGQGEALVQQLESINQALLRTARK